MPLVRNTPTGINYLEKINTDGDACSRTAIRSYNKQLGINGVAGRTKFFLPFDYDPGSHTLWVFVNGSKAVSEALPVNNRQYREVSNRSVEFGAGVAETDILEFIVAGSYLSDIGDGSGGGGLTWMLVSDPFVNVQNMFGYMADTRANTMSFILPENPVEGDYFAVIDAFGNFATRSATIVRSGNRINGVASNLILNKNGEYVYLVFDGIDNWIFASSDSPYVQREDTTNASRYMTFVEGSSPGPKRFRMDIDLYYNPSNNTMYTTANAANYADLAEKYMGDKKYNVGTVLCFGGSEEVTSSNTSHDPKIAGVVSEFPAYLMNERLKGDNVTIVALVGRVPCLVKGPVSKGDLLVSSDVPGVAQKVDMAKYTPGCVIGKSLVDVNHEDVVIVEIVVGKI